MLLCASVDVTACVRRGGGFYACSTNTFKLNYYEPPSGLRFILTTDLVAGQARLENSPAEPEVDRPKGVPEGDGPGPVPEVFWCEARGA